LIWRNRSTGLDLTDHVQQEHRPDERQLNASLNYWLEEIGEVELIGGWAQVTLAADFASQVANSDYQVLLTSYDAAVVFVQNRTAQGFEIHTSSVVKTKKSSAIRCGYCVLARRRSLAPASHR